jgi:nucleoside phosphorylase
MGSPTNPKSSAAASYSVRPRSLTVEAFDELIRRLYVIMEEVSIIPVDKGTDAAQLKEKRKQLLMSLSNYMSDLKLAQLLLYLPPGTPGFDDHDQVASSVLYRFNQYEHISDSENPTNRGLIDNFVAPQWGELIPSGKHIVVDAIEHHNLKSRLPINLLNFTSIRVGILTVLEHEYQSVIRRLDRIYVCSGEYAYGLAIRYRIQPTEDMKDLLARFREMGVVGTLDIGWTIGSIGAETVVVICTGDVGKDNTRESIKHIQKHLKLLVDNWLDVGVCAGSDKSWPIGTVLVSHEKVVDLERTGSDRFEKGNVIAPLLLSRPTEGTFSVQTSYRRVPRMNRVPVAPSESVPIYFVKFACVPDVIRLTHDKEAIRAYLVREGLLLSGEEFGMEMEGVGTTLHTNSSTMCVIKGVCDHGDNLKKSWPSEAKVLYQLYAAETAADYAVSLVRDWDNKVQSKKAASAV